MNPIVYAIPVFLLTILLEAWALRRGAARSPGAGYSVADAVTSLHFGVVSQVMIAFTWLFTFGFYLIAFEHLRLFTLPRDSLWTWAFALVIYDFCYYWAHRFGHEVNLLWAAHQVHHSSDHYNLTTALRQTATGAFTAWPFYVVMAVSGIPPFVFAIVALIDLLYQYWVHTEAVGKLGWADRVFVTPSNHRVHHGRNDYCIDRNYGGILIIWDRLFGTFAEERDDEKVVYGIRRPLASYDPVWGNLKGYRDIWDKSRSAADWNGSLRTWFARPADTGAAVSGGTAAAAFRRYDPAAPAAASGYAVFQYLLLLAPATHFIAIGTRLPWLDRTAYAAFLLSWVVGVGKVLQGADRARRIETVRVIVSAGAFALSPGWFGWATPDAARVAAAAAMAVALAWLPRACR
jgi:alkylglycerol monooxygenase